LTTGKRTKIVATRHVSWAQNYQNCDRGSALDPAGEAYSAPIDLLAEFRGREEERERQGQGGWTEGERGNYPSQKISVLDPPVLLDLTGGESPRYYHRAHDTCSPCVRIS